MTDFSIDPNAPSLEFHVDAAPAEKPQEPLGPPRSVPQMSSGPVSALDSGSGAQAGSGVALRQEIVAALASCQGGTTWDALTDAVFRAVQPRLDRLAEYEHTINWMTTCTSCARILDSAYAETVRAEQAEAALARIQALVAEHPVTVGTHLLEEALDQGGAGAPRP